MASKASSRVLINHDEIQSWAEQRGAKPAAVRNTGGNDGDEIGIIRLDFPGYSGEGSLEPIEWDEWFEKFDENNLALVVQEKTANGQRSNFNKLVNRENVETSDEDSGSSSQRTSTRRSASTRSNSGRSSRSNAAGARASSNRKSLSKRKSARGENEGRGSSRKNGSRASQKTTRSRKKAA